MKRTTFQTAKCHFFFFRLSKQCDCWCHFSSNQNSSAIRSLFVREKFIILFVFYFARKQKWCHSIKFQIWLVFWCWRKTELYWKVVANWKMMNAVRMWSHRWLIWPKRKFCFFFFFSIFIRMRYVWIKNLCHFYHSVDPKTFDKSDCQRISVIFEQHSYTICLSNKKVYVVKRLNGQLHRNASTSSTPAVAFQLSNHSVATVESETDEPSTSNTELAWIDFSRIFPTTNYGKHC